MARKLKVVPVESRTDYECVRLLTKLQRATVRGEFQSVAIVTTARNGEVGTGYAGDLQVFTTLGGLKYLSNRIEEAEID